MFMGTFCMLSFNSICEKIHIKYKLPTGNQFGKEVLWILWYFKRKKSNKLGSQYSWVPPNRLCDYYENAPHEPALIPTYSHEPALSMEECLGRPGHTDLLQTFLTVRHALIWVTKETLQSVFRRSKKAYFKIPPSQSKKQKQFHQIKASKLTSPGINYIHL